MVQRVTTPMDERMVDVDGGQVCVETFGDPGSPTVLLVAGAGQSMVWWEVGFCARLAAAGRHVVRYDHRDTGRSTMSPVGRPAYSSTDLRTDPLAILDALEVDDAHLVGLSMGGGLVQEIGLRDPDRVRSLTLMSTSPVVDVGHALPPPTPELAATFTAAEPEPDHDDRAAMVDYRVAIERPYAGRGGLDEPRVRHLAELDVDRAGGLASGLTNHVQAEDEPPPAVGLDAIAAPTLVVHGSDDPLFPVEHGRALAAAIPGARLVVLPGVGHQQPPPRHWHRVVDALVDHTR